MKNSNVFIISNEYANAKQLEYKILLSRNIDKITTLKYNEALEKIPNYTPELIIVIGNKIESTTIVQKLRFHQKFNNTPIVFASEHCNESLLGDIFDYGADDYINLEQSSGEIAIRIMWNLKKYQLINELESKTSLLNDLGAIDVDTGFYTKLFSEKIFKTEVEKLHTKDNESIFVILSADVHCKTSLQQIFLGSILKKTLRKSDIVGFAKDNRFYIILKNTSMEGAKAVFQKIQNNLINNYSISAAASIINSSKFDVLEKITSAALSEAIIKGNQLIFVNSKPNQSTNEQWIDKSKLKETNFKMFKQLFLKRFNKVVAPLFYQIQTSLSEKLFETIIKQEISESSSYFSLSRGENNSTLTIKYPGYSKINIEIKNKIGKETSSKRIMLDISELTTVKLESILREMVAEFQEHSNEIDQ